MAVSVVQLTVQKTSLSTSHPGQLSLAIPPWVGAMSRPTSQRAVTLCGELRQVWFVGWHVKLCDPLANTDHI